MTAPAKRRFPAGPALFAALAIVAGVVAYYGTRSSGTPSEPEGAPVADETGPVVSIALPAYDPDLPPGPNREAVRTACVTCHSTQLILNQPHLPEKKWEETVLKMVTAYGAPVPEPQQQQVLAYLLAIRGKE